jgi:hypothetical protein
MISIRNTLYTLLCISLISTFHFSQNFVKNGSFEFVDSCGINENGTPYNRPLDWFSSLQNSSEIIVHSTSSIELCAPSTLIKASNGLNYLQLGFKVNTSKVTTNYIQTELIRPLVKDSVYQISMKIRKNQFSIGSVQELQLLFSARKIPSTVQYGSRNLESAILKFNIDNVSSREWNEATIDYIANGFEYYLSIGSFYQAFNLKNGMRNYPAERILYSSNTPNAIYYIDAIEIVAKTKSTENPNKNVVERANLQNLLYRTTNLIINSGFEYSPYEMDRPTSYYPQGVELIPGWLGFGVSDASIYVVDSNSNFYQYNKLNGNYPYMGKGIAEVSVLRTNKHHHYQQVWIKHEGTDCMRIYKYENEPENKNIKKFEFGAYFTGILKGPLVRDSNYLFSMMSKLSSESSFGVKYIGVYFNQDIVRHFEDSLLKIKPDLLFDVSALSKANNWEEFSAFYKATGNENHFTIGYYYSDDNSIIKNFGFERVVSSSCGPNYTNGTYCLHYEATYRDSLFANYYFDNFLLRKVDVKEVLSAAIFDKSIINQTQWIFDFGGSKSNTLNVEKAKKLLIETLNIMRIDDGIAMTYINKANELKLAPTTYENKRKIIRFVDQYKLNIKPGFTFFQEYTLLFDGSNSKGYKNSVVFVTEGSLNFEKGMASIERYCKNGGKFTILCIGDSVKRDQLNTLFSSIPKVKILAIEEDDNLISLIRQLL